MATALFLAAISLTVYGSDPWKGPTYGKGGSSAQRKAHKVAFIMEILHKPLSIQ